MSEVTTRKQKLEGQSILIDKATIEDAESIIDIKRRAWLDTYPNESLGITKEDIRLRIEGKHGELIKEGIENWRRGIASEGEEPRITFVARIDNIVEGFVALRIVEGERFIGAMYVSPDMQERGIGSKLMSKALERYGRNEDIHLGVVDYNQKAIKFYEKYGFTKTGKKLGENETFESHEIEMILKAGKL